MDVESEEGGISVTLVSYLDDAQLVVLASRQNKKGRSLGKRVMS